MSAQFHDFLKVSAANDARLFVPKKHNLEDILAVLKSIVNLFMNALINETGKTLAPCR